MDREDVDLKVKLLTKGARVSKSGWDSYKRSAGFQIYLDDMPVSVPAWGKYERYWYVENSPYLIDRDGSRWNLLENEEKIREIRVDPKPPFYSKMTSDGIEMWRVFHVCGDNCLLTGVRQSCSYVKGGKNCKFCGTIFNPRYEGRLDIKTPGQLAEVAKEGLADGMKDIMLSSGVTKTPDRGLLDVAEAARAIKEVADVRIQAEVAVPENPSILRELSGCIDCISLNIETVDQCVRERVCPEKSNISYDDYFKAFELSLDIFGENQVNSWLIAGIGESDESIIEGAEMLAGAGVYPMLVALRPTKYTPFEKMSPPTSERLRHLSEAVAGIVNDAGLRPEENKAGCVRCGACSAVKDYAKL